MARYIDRLLDRLQESKDFNYVYVRLTARLVEEVFVAASWRRIRLAQQHAVCSLIG